MQAMNGNRMLGTSTQKIRKSTEKLSSGYRINRAADDAAGLAISEKMRGQIRGLDRGTENVEDGISLVQTADGALAEVSDMLHRIKELSVQAANDTNTKEDREDIQLEINEIIHEVDRIGNTTEFNTIPLFKGGKTVQSVVPVDEESNPLRDIPFEAFTLSGFEVGNTPFTASSRGSELGLCAVVKDDTSPMNGNATNLIYNAGSTSSSALQLKYKDNSNVEITKDVRLESCSISDYTLDNSTETISRKFTYEDSTDGINITIKQSIQVDNSGDTEKKYKISYDITNNSGKDVKTNFMFHADTAYGGRHDGDLAERYYVNGGKLEKTSIYAQTNSSLVSGSNSSYLYNSIPKDFSIFCEDEELALAFSEKITFHDTSKPSLVSFGQYASIRSWTYYGNGLNYRLGNNAIGEDLGFSLVWEKDLSNSNSFTCSFDYGIVAREEDENLHDVPFARKPASEIKYKYENEQRLWIQAGANSGQGMWLRIDQMNAGVLGIRDIDVTTHDSAVEALDTVDDALKKLTFNRSKIGAQQNRLEHAVLSNENTSENLQASESRIRDVDMATEMAEYSRYNILQQAGESVLAQANQITQGALSLLQ